MKKSPSKNHFAITQFPSPISLESVHKYSPEEKERLIAQHIKDIMEILGLDLTSESLRKTPERVATMYVREVFSGLDPQSFPNMALFDDEDISTTGDHIVITKVGLVSFCEHHLVPMFGNAYVGYIPRGTIIGLSKIARLTQYFSSRPQLQERLTAQIADCLSMVLGHPDVAVLIKAQHGCVVARGAKNENSETTTFYASGIFKSSHEKRTEFFQLVPQQNDVEPQ
jgi:GTP cyclohydrolase I